jgi:uncharacterized protein (UPF0276 family)
MAYSIGTTYEGKNFEYLQHILPYAGHIEISPDSIAYKKNGVVNIHPDALKQLQWLENNTDVSILIHGVGLSIGSYDGYSMQYIRLLDELFRKLTKIRWHSEHLAYTFVNGEAIGTMLTLPRTDEVIDMICRRVDTIQARYKAPFLLENVISMLPSPDCKYSDAAFLNRITGLTGCGLILDVYNLECDAYNFNLDIDGFISELNLDMVYEMHLAGGLKDTEFDFKMDVHAQLIADSTIALAKKIIHKNVPNLKAITFEILEEFLANHGSSKIIAELKKLSFIFNQDAVTGVTNQSLFGH